MLIFKTVLHNYEYSSAIEQKQWRGFPYIVFSKLFILAAFLPKESFKLNQTKQTAQEKEKRGYECASNVSQP